MKIYLALASLFAVSFIAAAQTGVLPVQDYPLQTPRAAPETLPHLAPKYYTVIRTCDFETRQIQVGVIVVTYPDGELRNFYNGHMFGMEVDMLRSYLKDAGEVLTLTQECKGAST